MPNMDMQLHAELEDRVRFETLISDISACFVTLAADKVDDAIDRALMQIMEFFDVQRCALLAVHKDKMCVHVAYACYAAGIEQVSKDMNLVGLYPWCYRQLIAQGRPVNVPRMAELPLEAEQDRLAWKALKVKSNLAIPLFSTHGIQYLLVIHSVHRERNWPDEYVSRLNLLGNVFVNALERRDRELALRESESRMNLAADSAGAGLWTLDVGRGTFWVTDRARSLFGFGPEGEISFERFLAAVHPQDRERVHQTVQRALQTRDEFTVQYRITHTDGSIRWMTSRGRSRVSASGEPSSLTGVTIDVTEYKRLEDEVKNAGVEWQRTFDTVQDLIMVLDSEFRIVRINKAVESFLGQAPTHILGKHCYALIYGTDGPSGNCPVAKASRSRQHEECEVYLAGKGIWLLISVDPILNDKGDAVGFINVLRDISARKRNEKKLLDSHESIRTYTSRLLTIQEEERRRLARELHDDFTQRLAVLAMDVSKLAMSAKASSSAWKSKLECIRDGIVKLSTDIHDVSRQLHPAIIDDLGLGRAIQSECSNFTRQTGIIVNYAQTDVPTAIPRSVSVVLFRITQEALRNIYKHAQVKQAKVALLGRDDSVCLTILDAGVGFDPSHAGSEHGLGLFSMEERAQLVEGVFSINTTPGRGTRIEVVIPLKKA